MEDSEKSKTEKKAERKLIWVLFGVILLIIGIWFLNKELLENKCFDDRGTFGDMFGGVNALFSGFALAGIIFTILLQRIELKYQREELIETRKEFKIQNSTLKLQRFENTFFSLLELHHKIVDSIDLDVEKQKAVRDMSLRHIEYETIKSRDVFKHTYNHMSQYLKTAHSENVINKIYTEHYQKYQTDFGHYFRNLYRMVKLVNDSELLSETKEDMDDKTKEKLSYSIKYKYTSIIRAQLSDYELLWLFYNGLSENGHEKFKPLIEKYTLLKNLQKDNLAQVGHKEHYEKYAFEKNESMFVPNA